MVHARKDLPVKWNELTARSRLHGVAGLILLSGLGAALLIYLTADADSTGAVGYITEEGRIVPMKPEDSKMYRHDLELYGGKWSLMADDFRIWFEGLWRGRSLARTVAVITFIVALGFFLVARNTPGGGTPSTKPPG